MYILISRLLEIIGLFLPKSPIKEMIFCIRGMGWLRLVGSLKLQVSFAEYRLFYRALLQKRPIILRRLVKAATPYRVWRCRL